MEGYIVQRKFVRTDIPQPSKQKDEPEKEAEKKD